MPDTTEINAYLDSPVLARVLDRWLDPPARRWAQARCTDLGALALGDLEELAARADRHPPQLHTHDKRGERIDAVEFHPAWDSLVDVAYRRFGLAAMSHRDGVLGYPGRVPEVAKQALYFLYAHAERSVTTGLSMTDVLARVLRLHAPALAARYLPHLTATDGSAWQAAMFLTEKAGGSDVGANELAALPDGDGWRLSGDKWFCSNVQADLILTLARPRGAGPGTAGLGLFLVPRRRADGSRNSYLVHRLKDKLGTRGLASGEVTFTGASAHLIGPPGTGFGQMTEMLNQTRVANAVVSAAMVHRSFLEARAHSTGRAAFGRRLADHPLMREVLAELALEAEVCTRLALYTAGQLQLADRGHNRAGRLLRVLTPLVKYHTARRAQWASHEAMEARGGNGYIENWPDARLVRDAHLMSIWEGSGNIMLLDAARALRVPANAAALIDDLAVRPAASTAAGLAPLARFLAGEAQSWSEEFARLGAMEPELAQLALRGLLERAVHLLAAGLLLQDAEDDLAGGDGRLALLAARYAASRLAPEARPVRGADRTLLTAFDAVVLGAPAAPADAVELLDRLGTPSVQTVRS
jgi:alkylation response protein AidB-like acyl-CoA dehydrogenase